MLRNLETLFMNQAQAYRDWEVGLVEQLVYSSSK